MTLRQPRMVEVCGCIVDHADVLYHAARAKICRAGERNKTRQPQRLKRVSNNRVCAFSRKASPPMCIRETPSNLDRRHKRRFEGWHGEPDEPNEGFRLDELSSIKPEAVSLKVLLNPDNCFVRFSRRKHRREKLHHPRIGIDRLKGLAIGLAPAAENQPLGNQFLRHGHKTSIPRTDLSPVEIFGELSRTHRYEPLAIRRVRAW